MPEMVRVEDTAVVSTPYLGSCTSTRSPRVTASLSPARSRNQASFIRLVRTSTWHSSLGSTLLYCT